MTGEQAVALVVAAPFFLFGLAAILPPAKTTDHTDSQDRT